MDYLQWTFYIICKYWYSSKWRFQLLVFILDHYLLKVFHLFSKESSRSWSLSTRPATLGEIFDNFLCVLSFKPYQSNLVRFIRLFPVKLIIFPAFILVLLHICLKVFLWLQIRCNCLYLDVPSLICFCIVGLLEYVFTMLAIIIFKIICVLRPKYDVKIIFWAWNTNTVPDYIRKYICVSRPKS